MSIRKYKKSLRGFGHRNKWLNRKPWLKVKSVEEWEEWAKVVVPAEFAYRTWVVGETDSTLEVPQIGNWPYTMCFLAEYCDSREWAIKFTTLGENFGETPKGLAAFTNGIKLISFAQLCLVWDDERDWPIPSYDETDLNKAYDLIEKIETEDFMEIVKQVNSVDCRMDQRHKSAKP